MVRTLRAYRAAALICWLIVVLAVLIFMAKASSAQTVIVAPPDAHFPYQQWVDESKLPTPPVTLEVVETGAEHGCPGREENYVACTSPSEGVVWIAPEAAAEYKPRQTFYHEIGHNVDADLLPEWMRERFMQIRHMSGPWAVEGEGVAAARAPEEKFADVWAECAIRPHVSEAHPDLWGNGPLGPGTAADHNRICRMLARL